VAAKILIVPLKRLLIVVPVPAPKFSSYLGALDRPTWVHSITPYLQASRDRSSRGSVIEVVVHDDITRRLFPTSRCSTTRRPCSCHSERLSKNEVESSWTDVLTSNQGGKSPVALDCRRGHDHRAPPALVTVPSATAYARLGGQRGWLPRPQPDL
jgi:hypothetical protein